MSQWPRVQSYQNGWKVGRVYPAVEGKTEEVMHAPRIPSLGAVPPKRQHEAFPCGWDERDAKV